MSKPSCLFIDQFSCGNQANVSCPRGVAIEYRVWLLGTHLLLQNVHQRRQAGELQPFWIVFAITDTSAKVPLRQPRITWKLLVGTCACPCSIFSSDPFNTLLRLLGFQICPVDKQIILCSSWPRLQGRGRPCCNLVTSCAWTAEPSSTVSTVQLPGTDKHVKIWAIVVGAVVGAVLIFAIIGGLIWCCWRRAAAHVAAIGKYPSALTSPLCAQKH